MRQKVTIVSFILSIISFYVRANDGSFTVSGDPDKFYPVLWNDGGWNDNTASELEIGRSITHTDASWRGAFNLKLRYHTTNWGNGANFIDADIYSGAFSVAGWGDATISNGNHNIIVWLRGGGTTYYFHSRYETGVTVYDGVQNSLPFQEENGPAHTFKIQIDSYVNNQGLSMTGTGKFSGGGVNYFADKVGIGTDNTNGYQLAVKENVVAESVTVKLQGNWPDYVFNPGYELMSLDELKNYVTKNHHLPEILSAKEMNDQGLNLGETNKLLMKKIEELTLYLLEKDRREKEQQQQIDLLNEKVEKISKLIR